MTSTEEIAQWMLGEFNKHGRLIQNTAARRIRALFGEACEQESQLGYSETNS